MAQFFIAFETETKGFIIDTFDSEDKANAVLEKCLNLFELTDEDVLFVLRRKRSYSLNNDPFVYEAKKGSIMGLRNVYLIEIGNYWKSINHFIADREFIPKYLEGTELMN